MRQAAATRTTYCRSTTTIPPNAGSPVTTASSNRENGADSEPQPFGHFGANENGLYDTAGNVWEWTSTCFVRTRLDDDGQAMSKHSNCGVRVAEGQHRTYVTDFIRDARAGGCAAGVPPSNLGFRLVRERKPLLSQFSSGLRKALSIARS